MGDGSKSGSGGGVVASEQRTTPMTANEALDEHDNFLNTVSRFAPNSQTVEVGGEKITMQEEQTRSNIDKREDASLRIRTASEFVNGKADFSSQKLLDTMQLKAQNSVSKVREYGFVFENVGGTIKASGFQTGGKHHIRLKPKLTQDILGSFHTHPSKMTFSMADVNNVSRKAFNTVAFDGKYAIVAKSMKANHYKLPTDRQLSRTAESIMHKSKAFQDGKLNTSAELRGAYKDAYNKVFKAVVKKAGYVYKEYGSAKEMMGDVQNVLRKAGYK